MCPFLKGHFFYPLCEPSQYGGFLVSLQLHKNTDMSFSIENFKDFFSVSLERCDPSQNGLLLEKPQLHQK